MTTRPRLRPLARLLTPRAGPTEGRARRRTARAAVLSFGLAFALLTLGLAVAAETVRPQWRDPEYGNRLRQVRRWQQERPDRPLVLVLGSSRTQLGVSPAEMDFPDRPGSPLVYNFGFTGAYPVGMWFQLTRAFDDGVRPAAVLVELATVHTKSDGGAEEQLRHWGPRLSAADLRRFEPYTKDAAVFRRELDAARANPWAARRGALVSDLVPAWQLAIVRNQHIVWERIDDYGYTLAPSDWAHPSARPMLCGIARQHAHAINHAPPGAASTRALRELVARCRAGGVAVALFQTPESPEYRAMYTAEGRARTDAYTRALAEELGVPVFPAPEHLEEGDFADGYHLLPGGATKYSRWLAENHLKPWLAEVLK